MDKDNFNKAKNKSGDIIEKIKTICIILLSIILFIYLALGINNMRNGGKMGFFTLRFYIMSSVSNESGTSTGDLIVANNTKANNIKENDDIIYKRNNTMIIKKVIKTENKDNENNIFIENDNANTNSKIENDKIMGKVLFKIKGVGNIAMFIQTPLGTVNIILIFVCILILIRKIFTANNNDSDNNDDNNNGDNSDNNNGNNDCNGNNNINNDNNTNDKINDIKSNE